MIPDPPSDGYLAMIIACCFSSLMGAFLYGAHVIESGFSSVAAGLVRVAVTATVVLLPRVLRRRGPSLWSDGHPSLWLWAAASAINLSCYVAAIQRLGMGEATFLMQATCTVGIVALSPWLLREALGPATWLALLGATAGLYLMSAAGAAGGDATGRALALLSGAATAVAYLTVGRMRRTQPASTILFYWCVGCALFYLAVASAAPVSWPARPAAWACLVASAVMACVAQYGYTVAYQRGPAGPLTSLSYLTPVLSLGLDGALFSLRPSAPAYAGACLIVGFGVLLPLVPRVGMGIAKPVFRDATRAR